MADVTISSLTKGTPSPNHLLPYSTGNDTLATPVSALFQGSSSLYLVNPSNPTIWASTDISLASQSVYIQANTTSLENRIGSYTNHPLTLVTNNVERMRIDANGDVSIPGKLTNAGVAKAWVAFNGYNNFTPIGGETRCQVLGSYNIQKVVKVNTGQYNVYFNTEMPSTPYCVTGSCGDVQGAGNERISIYPNVMYASYFMVHSYQYNDVLGDNGYVSVVVFSN